MSTPAEFVLPIDIMNRALQRVGQTKIATLTDDSKACDEVTFCYDKLRIAEMRRNNWTFSMRRVVLRPYQGFQPIGPVTGSPAVLGTMKLVPATWSATATYIKGSFVQYQNKWYTSRTDNLNSQPDINPTDWSQYFGPVTVNPYDTSGKTQYYAGELVYLLSGNTPTVFMCLTSLNGDTPGTINPWVATTYYNIDDTAIGSDLATYQCKANFSLNQNPVTDAGVHWIAVPGTQVDTMSGQNWMKTDAAVTTLRFVYPVEAGPTSDPMTYNVFFKPHGFLREAPQNPKAGNISFLGGPANNTYQDWIFSGEFILSRDTDPISLRFAADVANVQDMDAMFCEGLACRIAMEVCEPLTQSQQKLQGLGAMYKQFMADARIVNGIEQGAAVPSEDDYVACRR